MGNLLAKNFCVLVTGQKQRLVLYVFQVALIKGCVSYDPQRCTADAEMKVPSVEKSELTKFSFKARSRSECKCMLCRFFSLDPNIPAHASPTEQECCFSLISALFSFIISNPLSHSRQLGWSVGQGYFPRHCALDLPWFLLASAATWLSLTPFSTPRWLTPTASPATARAAKALTTASPMEEPGTQWAEVRISGFVDMFCLALKGNWSKEKQQQNLSVGIEWKRDRQQLFYIFIRYWSRFFTEQVTEIWPWVLTLQCRAWLSVSIMSWIKALQANLFCSSFERAQQHGWTLRSSNSRQ